MLGLGMSEILLVCAVILIAVGPERLPQLMRTIGRHYGKMRRSADELRRAFVLEADRQDAEARIDALREKRAQAAKDQAAGLSSGATGTHAQAERWPAPAEGEHSEEASSGSDGGLGRDA